MTTSTSIDTDYEVVIGLEVHAQLLTKSKMFCSCSTGYANEAPNTHVCPICMGMPGVLPVINMEAVKYTIMTALALHCSIPPYSKFDRKNYPYPDLMKGYQISQYDIPLSRDGYLTIDLHRQIRRIGITRVHLEEDTARLTHHDGYSLIDINRSGTPLMEIVSEPDLRSADEARDYAMELRTLLRTIGASEADMEKGQLRAEPNISIRRAGADELGVKTELKNINSFRALHRAILYEVDRQRQVVESGGAVVQETRGWSEAEQRTFSQRSKEFAEDYRYFPEPDLPPLELDRAWVEELRAALPELPSVRRARLLEQLPATHVAIIGADRELADLYETAVARGAPPASTANWIVNEVAPSGKLLSPESLAELMKLMHDGNVTRDQAREAYLEAVETGRTPAEIVAEHGYAQVSDESELRVIAEAVIDANPQAATDYRAGKKQAMQALMADLRKRAPQANPRVASELLLRLLA